MAMMVSPEVAKLFQVLTGEEWPDANEDQLRAFSAEWATAAQALGTQLGPGLRAAVQAIRQDFEGEAERAFVARVSPFIEGDNYIDAAAELFAKLSDFLADLARDVEYMKLVSIYSLIALLAEIAWAIAMSPFTGGGSMAWLAARMAIVRFLLKSLLGKLLLQVLQAAVFGIAFQLLIDAAAQATQFAMGTRDEWNTKYTANAAGVGAMGAALAPFFSGFGKLLSDKLTKFLDDYFTKSLGKAWHKNLPKIITEMGTEAFHETLTEALYKYATEGEFEMNPYSTTSGAASGGGSAGGDAFGKYMFNVPPDGGPTGGDPRGGPPEGETGGDNNPTGAPGGGPGGNGPTGGPGGGPNGGPGGGPNGGPNGGPGGGPNGGPGGGPNGGPGGGPGGGPNGGPGGDSNGNTNVGGGPGGGFNNGPGGGFNSGPNGNSGSGPNGGNSSPGGLNGDQPRGFGSGTNTPSNDPFSPQGNGNSGPTDVVAGPNPTETGNQNSTTPTTVPPPVASPESAQAPENAPPTQEQSPVQTPPIDPSGESGSTTPITEQPVTQNPVPNPNSPAVEPPPHSPESSPPTSEQQNPIIEPPAPQQQSPDSSVIPPPIPESDSPAVPEQSVPLPPPSDSSVTEQPVLLPPPADSGTEQPLPVPPPVSSSVSEQPVPVPIPTDSSVTEQSVPVPTPTDSSVTEQSVPVPTPTDSSVTEQSVPVPTPTDSSMTEQPVLVPPPVSSSVSEQPGPVPPPGNSVSEQSVLVPPPTESSVTEQPVSEQPASQLSVPPPVVSSVVQPPVPAPVTEVGSQQGPPPPVVGQTGQTGQQQNSTSPTPTPPPASGNSGQRGNPVPATNQKTETAPRTAAPEMRPGPSTQDAQQAVATLGMSEPATTAETHELTTLPPRPRPPTPRPDHGKTQEAEQAAEAAATARDNAASAVGRARHADRQARHHLAVTQRSVNDSLGALLGTETAQTLADQRVRQSQQRLNDATRARDDLAVQHEQAADNLALAQQDGAGARIRRWATSVRQLTGPLDTANTVVDQANRNLTTVRGDADAIRVSVDTARDAHTKAQAAAATAQQAVVTTGDALQRAGDNLAIANTAATDAATAVDAVRTAVDLADTARTDADNATTVADTARDHVTDLIRTRDDLTEQITGLDQQLTEDNPDLQTRRDSLAEQRHTLDTTTIPQAITEADTRTDEANDAHTRHDDAVRTVDTRLSDVTTQRDTAQNAETAANTGRDDAQQAAKDAEKAKDDATDAANQAKDEHGLTRVSTLPPNSELHIETVGSLDSLIDAITTLTGQDRTTVTDQLGPDSLADAINTGRIEIGPVTVAITADLHRPADPGPGRPTTKGDTSSESGKPLSESSSSSLPIRIPLMFVSPVDAASAAIRPMVYAGATVKRSQRFDSSTTVSSSTGTEQTAPVPATIAITVAVPNQPPVVAPVDAGLRLPDLTAGRPMSAPPQAYPALGITADQTLTYLGTAAVDHSNSSSHSNGSSVTRGSDANFGAGLYGGLGGPKGWFIGGFTDFSSGFSDGTNPANEHSSSHSRSDVELVYQVDDQPRTVHVPVPLARSLGLPLPPHLNGPQPVTNAQPEYLFGKDDIKSVNNEPVVEFLTDGLGDRGRDAVTDKFGTPEQARDSIYNAMHGGEQAVWQENGRTHVVDIYARPAPPTTTDPSGQTSTSAEDKNSDQFRRTVDSKRTARFGVGGAFLPTGTDTPNPNAPKATPEAGNPNPYQGGPTTSGGAPRVAVAATWESGYSNKSGYTGRDGRGSTYGGDIRDFDGPLDFVVVHRSTKTPNWAQRLFLGDRMLFGPDATSRVTEPTKADVDQAFAGNQPPAEHIRTGRVDDAIHVSTPSDKLPWATKPLPQSQMTPGVYLGDPPATAPRIDPKGLGEFTNVEHVRVTPNTTEGVYLALAKRVEPVNGGHDLPTRIPPVGSGNWPSWGRRTFTETRTGPDGTQTVTDYTYKNSVFTGPGTTSGDAVRDFVGRVGSRGTASNGIGGLSNSTGKMYQPGRLNDFNGELKATSEYSSPRLVDVRAEGALKRNQAGDHLAGSTKSRGLGLDAEVSLGVAPKRDSGVGALLRGVFGGGWKSGSSHAVDLTSGGKQAHEYTGPTAFVAMDVRYNYAADLNLRNVFKTTTFDSLPVTVDQPDGVLVEMPVAHAIDLFNSLDLPVPPELAGALPDTTSTVDNPAHTLLRGDEYASHSDTTVFDSALTGDNPLGPVTDKLNDLGVDSVKWRTEILDQIEKMLSTPSGHVWLRDPLAGDTGLISVPNADVAFEDVVDIRVTATPNETAPVPPQARPLVPDKQVNADYLSSSTQDKKSTTWTAAAALEAGLNSREVPSVPPGQGATPNAGASNGSFTPQIIGVSRSVKTEDVLPSSSSEKLTTQVDTNKVGRSGHGVDYHLSISRRRTPMPAFDTPLLGLPKRVNWDTAPGDPITVSGTVDLVSPGSDASPPLTRPQQPPTTEVVAQRPERTPMFGPKDGWRIESFGSDTVRAIRDAVYSQLGGRPLPMGPATPEAVADSAAHTSDHTRPGGNAEYTVHGATLGTSMHHGSTTMFTGDGYHVENIVGRKHTFHDTLFDLTVTADFHEDSFRFVAPVPEGTIMNLSQDSESGKPEGSTKTVSVSSGPSLPWSAGNTHSAAGPAPTTVATGPPVSEGISTDTTTATSSNTGEATGTKHTGRSYLYRADADFYTEAKTHGSNWTHGTTDSVVKIGSRDDLQVRVWENEALDKGLLTIADMWSHGGKQPPAGLAVTSNDRGATLHPTGQPAPNPPVSDTPRGRNLHVAPNVTTADVKSFVGSLPKDMRPTTYTVTPDATFTPADIRAEVTTLPEPATTPTPTDTDTTTDTVTVPNPLPAPPVVPTDTTADPAVDPATAAADIRAEVTTLPEPATTTTDTTADTVTVPTPLPAPPVVPTDTTADPVADLVTAPADIQAEVTTFPESATTTADTVAVPTPLPAPPVVPTDMTVDPVVDLVTAPADVRAEVTILPEPATTDTDTTTAPVNVPNPLPAPTVVPTDSLGGRQRQPAGESSNSQPRSAPPVQQQTPVQVRSHQEIAAWFSDALRKFGMTPFLSGGAALGFQQGSRTINDLDFRVTVSDAEFRQFGEDGGKRLLTYLNEVMVKDLQREYRSQRGNTPGGKVEQFFPLGGPDGSRTIGSPNVLGHEVSVSVVPGDKPPTIPMDLDGSGRQVDVLVPEELRADKLRTMVSRTKTGDESVKKVAQDLFDFLDAMDLIDGRAEPDSLPERTADHVADSVTARFGQYRDGNLDGQQLHHLGDPALYDLMLARAVLTARAHVQHGPRRDALDAILKSSSVRSGGPHGLRLTERLEALANLPVPPGVTTELRPWMRSWNDPESFGPPPGRGSSRQQWRPGAEAGTLPPTESQAPPPAVSDLMDIHADDLDANVRAAVPKSSTDIEQVVRVLAFSGGFRELTDSRSDRQTLEAFGLTRSAFGKAFKSLRDAGLVAPNAVGLSLTRAGWDLVPTSGPSRLLGPDGAPLNQPAPNRPFTPDELNTIDDMSREARTNLDALSNQVRQGLRDRSARVLTEAGWHSPFPSRGYRQAMSIIGDALQDGAAPAETRDLATTLHSRRGDYYRPPNHTTGHAAGNTTGHTTGNTTGHAAGHAAGNTDAVAGTATTNSPESRPVREEPTGTDTAPEPRPGKRSREEFEADEGPVTVPEPPHTRPMPEQLIAPAPEDTVALQAAVPPGTRFADPETFVELINGSRSGHGRDVNCVDAALAFHATYHGEPRVAGIAADGVPRSAATAAGEELSFAPELFSRGETGLAEVVERVRRAGHGADAIVFGFPRSGQGHAWNVVNHHGVVSFVDAQDGTISAPTTNPVPGLDRVYAIPLDADGDFITDDAGPPAPPADPDPYAAAEHARAVESHELRAAAAAGEEIPVPGTSGKLVPSLGGLRLVGAVITAELAAALSATTGRDVIALVVGPDAEYPEFLRFIPRGRPLPVE